MYWCYCETGNIVQNECIINDLNEVRKFVKSLLCYEMTICDYDSLIQVRKFEKFEVVNGDITRVLVIFKESKIELEDQETTVCPHCSYRYKKHENNYYEGLRNEENCINCNEVFYLTKEIVTRFTTSKE